MFKFKILLKRLLILSELNCSLSLISVQIFYGVSAEKRILRLKTKRKQLCMELKTRVSTQINTFLENNPKC